MFGTFDEKALAAYAEQVKQKRVKAGQGTEYADNLGVGEHDHSFLDTDESQDLKDYTEFAGYDFGACVREGEQL
jgi:hypothetical protein